MRLLNCLLIESIFIWIFFRLLSNILLLSRSYLYSMDITSLSLSSNSFIIQLMISLFVTWGRYFAPVWYHHLTISYLLLCTNFKYLCDKIYFFFFLVSAKFFSPLKLLNFKKYFLLVCFICLTPQFRWNLIFKNRYRDRMTV